MKILRCLLLRELGKEDPNQLDRWNMLMNFEAHLDLRKSIPKVLFMSKLIRNFIQDLCKLTQFDDTIIDFILGTIDVNAFKNITNPLFLNGKAVQSSIQKLVPFFAKKVNKYVPAYLHDQNFIFAVKCETWPMMTIIKFSQS